MNQYSYNEYLEIFFRASILDVVKTLPNWLELFMNRQVEELIRFIRQNHPNCPEFAQMNNFEIYSILGNEIERIRPGKFLCTLFRVN